MFAERAAFPGILARHIQANTSADRGPRRRGSNGRPPAIRQRDANPLAQGDSWLYLHDPLLGIPGEDMAHACYVDDEPLRVEGRIGVAMARAMWNHGQAACP